MKKVLVNLDNFLGVDQFLLKFLENVNATNPKAIGFDVFFTEKDKQSPDEFLKAYNLIPTDVGEIQNLKGHDEKFSEQLEKSNSVTAVLGSNVPSHSNYDRKAKARFLSKGGDPKKVYLFLPLFNRIIRNVRKKV